GDHGGCGRTPLHHGRLAELCVDDSARHHLHHENDQTPGRHVVATPASPGLWHCRGRCGALPVAGESGRAVTAHVWRAASHAARVSGVDCQSTTSSTREHATAPSDPAHLTCLEAVYRSRGGPEENAPPAAWWCYFDGVG